MKTVSKGNRKSRRKKLKKSTKAVQADFTYDEPYILTFWDIPWGKEPMMEIKYLSSLIYHPNSGFGDGVNVDWWKTNDRAIAIAQLIANLVCNPLQEVAINQLEVAMGSVEMVDQIMAITIEQGEQKGITFPDDLLLFDVEMTGGWLRFDPKNRRPVFTSRTDDDTYMKADVNQAFMDSLDNPQGVYIESDH